MSIELKVGVVGYCPPTRFNERSAKRIIVEAYNKIVARYGNHNITVVSGLTNVGVPKIAYEEAVRRGWRTVGIACKRAQEHPLFPVDREIIVGKKWGDESETFLKEIDVIIRVGIGEQSIRETEQAKIAGKSAYEYNLPALT